MEDIVIPKRRIIICGWFRYPHGDATANYVQYLSKALVASGYEVVILSRMSNEYGAYTVYAMEGLKYLNICFDSKSKKVSRVINGRLFPAYFSRRLQALNLKESDVVVVHPSFVGIDVLLKYKKKIHFKTIGLPLEWFGREQYKNEKEAQKGELTFRKNEKHDLLFPISHNISNQFPNTPCVILPIMADAEEYPFHPKPKSKKYKFIFPANGMMKDALREMLLGLCSLLETELNRLEFHLTGVTDEQINSILTVGQRAYLERVLVIHAWMRYEDLVALYQDVHYLFLARETNQMTLSNFPSKVPEVMTHGVVPVVSDVGDYTTYYLQDSVDSLIFKGCDVVSCAGAMKRAISLDYSDYAKLSYGAYCCVENKFDYHCWMHKITESIEKMFS